MIRATVTGASGFIGSHLVKYLIGLGYFVRGVDVRKPEFEQSQAHEFLIVDLRDYDACSRAVAGAEEVYHLAAVMGGIGFISGNHAAIAMDNIRIDMNMLRAAHVKLVNRFFYSSSACVYAQDIQSSEDVSPLREVDAWPADPERGYGLEKLYMEEMLGYYRHDYEFPARIARFHNIFGPCGTYDGGKEKAPAALCRKVALAKNGDSIEIWGDGNQTRSFLYIDECVQGISKIMQSIHAEPFNLGSSELVSIKHMAEMIIRISGKKLTLRFDVSKPQGVRGRNSDNTLIKQKIGWSSSYPLELGLEKTYKWIYDQVNRRK